MGVLELIIVGLGLGMDALAVSVCLGLSMRKSRLKKTLVIALYFGVFHTIIPFIGYALGSQFSDLIDHVDHWIAFGVLLLVGLKMWYDGHQTKNACEYQEPSLAWKAMIPLSFVISVDALAIGVSFAFLNVSILAASIIIGVTAFVLTFAGVKLGNLFGAKLQSKALFLGGLSLILVGVKILFDHFFM